MPPSNVANVPQGWRAPALHIALLLAAAVVFGGGGVAYGLMNLVVQLAALTVLALHRVEAARFWASAPRGLRWLLIATFALPLLQLVPLPPAIWQALPGRELAFEARNAAGVSGWFPLSVAPHRTLVAVLGLIPAATILVVGWRVEREHLPRLAWIMVALGLFNIAAGAIQVTSQGATGLLYPENPMPGVLFGTFANRNSTGLFLVACLCLLLTKNLRQGSTFGRGPALAAAGLILVAIVLTQSRSSMVLALIPIGLGVIRWFGSRLISPRLGVASAILVVAGAAILAISPQSRLDTSIARFAQTEDARSHIWQDAAYSARRYWPAGAGMGTFDEVFQADESLEHMSFRRAGRAHADYLEVGIEAGASGLLLILAWIVWIGWWSWRARLSEDRWLAWSGSSVLTVIALQSLLDYPLRNQAMLVIGAFALLLLARGAAGEEQ